MKTKENKGVIISSCVPLPIENIDTDQIIPARFLKAVTREGFGDNLFRDWRFTAAGTPVQDFVLNNRNYSGQILVAGRNFGCGSSREHAAWALYDYGFRVIISSFFADIFKNNALNNRILSVQVPQPFLTRLFALLAVRPDTSVRIDIDKQVVEVVGARLSESFEISSYRKQCLLNGYDDIDFLVSIRDDISFFESKRLQL